MSAIETQDPGGDNEAATGSTPEAVKHARAVSLASYRRVLTTIFLAGVFFVCLPVLLFLVPILLSSASNGMSTILVIALIAGALGAMFSTLIRAYNYDNAPAVLVKVELQNISHYHLFMYSLVPLVVGSLAAGAFFMLMASGMVQGTMFARFACTMTKACDTLSGMVQHWAPATAQDYGKVMIWGFVCGFAERLIPDALKDYLATTGNPKRQL